MKYFLLVAVVLCAPHSEIMGMQKTPTTADVAQCLISCADILTVAATQHAWTNNRAMQEASFQALSRGNLAKLARTLLEQQSTLRPAVITQTHTALDAACRTLGSTVTNTWYIFGITEKPHDFLWLQYAEKMTDLHIDKLELDNYLERVMLPASLTSVRLTGCQITALPNLSDLTELKKLTLYKNKLSPQALEQIKPLKSLTQLDLSINELTELPDDFFTQLANLQKLELSMNKLNTLPASITNLKNLTYLDLNDNKWLGAPAAKARLNLIGSLSSLKTLNISEIFQNAADAQNAIEPIVKTLTKLQQLEELKLEVNQLKDRALGHIFTLTKLKKIVLSVNDLTTIQPSITKMTNLIELEMSYNKLDNDAFKTICQVASLQELSLAYNKKITTIPQDIANLTQLKELRLGGCTLETQSLKNLEQLSALRTLNLSYCDLKDDAIDLLKGLGQLTVLDLQGNYLSETKCKEVRKALPNAKINTEFQKQPPTQ